MRMNIKKICAYISSGTIFQKRAANSASPFWRTSVSGAERNLSGFCPIMAAAVFPKPRSREVERLPVVIRWKL